MDSITKRAWFEFKKSNQIKDVEDGSDLHKDYMNTLSFQCLKLSIAVKDLYNDYVKWSK